MPLGMFTIFSLSILRMRDTFFVYILAIVKSVTVHIVIQLSNILGIYPLVRWTDYMASLFLVFKEVSTLFSTVATLIYIPTFISVPFLDTLGSLLLCVLWILSVLIGTKWILVVLICDSLVASDVDRCFVHLLAVSVSSLENCLLKSFAHFSVGWLWLHCDTENENPRPHCWSWWGGFAFLLTRYNASYSVSL